MPFAAIDHETEVDVRFCDRPVGLIRDMPALCATMRWDLDAMICGHATRACAADCTGHGMEVLDTQAGTVTLTEGPVQTYGVLIGADGSTNRWRGTFSVRVSIAAASGSGRRERRAADTFTPTRRSGSISRRPTGGTGDRGCPVQYLSRAGHRAVHPPVAPDPACAAHRLADPPDDLSSAPCARGQHAFHRFTTLLHEYFPLMAGEVDHNDIPWRFLPRLPRLVWPYLIGDRSLWRGTDHDVPRFILP